MFGLKTSFSKFHTPFESIMSRADTLNSFKDLKESPVMQDLHSMNNYLSLSNNELKAQLRVCLRNNYNPPTGSMLRESLNEFEKELREFGEGLKKGKRGERSGMKEVTNLREIREIKERKENVTRGEEKKDAKKDKGKGVKQMKKRVSKKRFKSQEYLN